MQAAIGRRVMRIIAVLALALGVLAMHGPAGGHHARAAAVPTAVAAAAAEHGADAAHTGAHTGQELLASAATSPVHVHGAVCDGDCSEHTSGLLLLCVAILIATSGALALQRRSRTWSMAPKTGPPPRVRARSTAPLRRLDLVADLCISRT